MQLFIIDCHCCEKWAVSGLKWRRRRGHASISPASQHWGKWLDIIMGTIMFIFCPIPASLCVQKVSVMTVIDECAGGKAALRHYQIARYMPQCSSGPGAASAVMPASGTTARECRFHITPSKPPHHTDSKDHMLSTKLLKYCILPIIIILWFCDYDDYVENCFSWFCPLLKSGQKAGLDYDWWIVQ